MQAGKLRHRLVFQEKTETQSRSGAAVETWADSFSVYGAFEPLGGREFPVNQKRIAETTARFRVRYRPDIDVDINRISHNSQTWNILAVLPVDGRNIELLIEASELR